MEWNITPGLTDYPTALEAMAARVAAIQRGEAEELVWLVEHPPLYTLGTSAKQADVLGHDIPAYETGRGGQVTYHGPGQRVVYLMLDLKKRAAAKGQEPDLRAYVQGLERWIIATLAEFGITGFTREGRVGVWVAQGSGVSGQGSGSGARVAGATSPLEEVEKRVPNGAASRSIETRFSGEGHHAAREAKIAALGVRVQKWVTSHGIALNVNPDLSHYAGIVPCGIREFGVTSMHAMGVTVEMGEVDKVLRNKFLEIFEA